MPVNGQLLIVNGKDIRGSGQNSLFLPALRCSRLKKPGNCSETRFLAGRVSGSTFLHYDKDSGSLPATTGAVAFNFNSGWSLCTC